MNNNDKILGCGGMLTLFLLSIVMATFINGWVLSILWGWFIVPVFGLPGLSIVQSIGIAMTIGFLITKSEGSTKSDSQPWIDIISAYIGRILIAPIGILAIGWFISGLI